MELFLRQHRIVGEAGNVEVIARRALACLQIGGVQVTGSCAGDRVVPGALLPVVTDRNVVFEWLHPEADVAPEKDLGIDVVRVRGDLQIARAVRRKLRNAGTRSVDGKKICGRGEVGSVHIATIGKHAITRAGLFRGQA